MSKKNSARKIVFEDKEIDDLYLNIDNKIYNRKLHQPYTYDVIENHAILYIQDEVRIIKYPDKKIAISEWVDNKWVDKDYYNLSQMWPLSNLSATPIISYNHIVNNSLKKYLDDFIKNKNMNYSEYINIRNSFSLNEEEKKLRDEFIKFNENTDKLSFILNKKWDRRINSKAIKNIYGCSKFMWENFVDKKIFKSILKVYGFKKNKSGLPWGKYFELHNSEDKDLIIDKINDFGYLAPIFSKYLNNDFNSILKINKSDFFNKDDLEFIEKQPPTVQNLFAEKIANILDWNIEKNNYEKISNDFKKVLNIYKEVSSQKIYYLNNKLTKRDMLLIAYISCFDYSYNYTPFDFGLLSSPNFGKIINEKTNFKHVSELIQLYKMFYKDDYKKGGMSYFSNFHSILKIANTNGDLSDILEKSMVNKNFINFREKLILNYEINKELENECKKNSKSNKVEKRKRKM